MLNLGIHQGLEDALMATLVDSHRIRTLIRIHDHDEQPVSHFQFSYARDHHVSGSVQVDATGTPTRTLNLGVIDPKGRLIFTPSSPAHGTVYAGYFISAEYCVWIPKPGLYPEEETYPEDDLFPDDPTSRDAGVWVNIPVFWGPLTRFESVGPQITLEAKGKETRLLSPYLATKGYPIKKHTRIDDALRRLATKAGETRFDLPELPYKLAHERVVDPRSEPWLVAAGGETDSNGKPIRGLVERTGKHPHYLVYDPRGRLAAPRLNREPVFTFDSSTIASQPDYSFDESKFKNHIVVRGAKLKGKHSTAHAEVSLPAEHPLSPDSLSRNGQPGYLPLFVDDGHLRTDRACAERAYHLLRHHSEIGVDVSFDCLPIPMLEEHDAAILDYGGWSTRFPIRQMTIPLTADQLMTVGSHKRAPHHTRANPGRRGAGRGARVSPARPPRRGGRGTGAQGARHPGHRNAG